jgi:hypothetical protein
VKKSKKGRVPSLTRRRVYILGAGASASCGIALAKDILSESITRLAGVATDVSQYHALGQGKYLRFRFSEVEKWLVENRSRLSLSSDHTHRNRPPFLLR